MDFRGDAFHEDHQARHKDYGIYNMESFMHYPSEGCNLNENDMVVPEEVSTL